jgi:hypothetical protein
MPFFDFLLPFDKSFLHAVNPKNIELRHRKDGAAQKAS